MPTGDLFSFVSPAVDFKVSGCLSGIAFVVSAAVHYYRHSAEVPEFTIGVTVFGSGHCLVDGIDNELVTVFLVALDSPGRIVRGSDFLHLGHDQRLAEFIGLPGRTLSGDGIVCRFDRVEEFSCYYRQEVRRSAAKALAIIKCFIRYD